MFAGIGRNKAQRELKRILKGKEVPCLSGMVMRVLQRLRDPEVDFAQIAEDLQWDPALTVQVLKTVNSAAYGLSQPIHDVHHAVRFLGRSALEQVVMGVAVRSTLPNGSAPGFDVERFWRTGSLRAIMARSIAERLHPASQVECFTAALLQDLAIPVLAHNLSARYGPVLSSWHNGSAEELHQLEQDALGWNHASVGGLLCSYWEMPKGLGACIAGHHDDQMSDTELFPALRLVALIRECADPEHQEEFLEIAHKEYGLLADDLLMVQQEAEEQAHEFARLYAS